ncbi:uncharacterized protein LOC142626882 [Castanea sativa]|uniref:uncharacterized protein LOC142626882 n=1 Tax=Castanea sativa TaxID=21020 RepID=UPI003F64C5E9
MDLFRNAKAVRLRSHHDKYLVAEEDQVSVTQERNGSSTSSKRAWWTVEFVKGTQSIIRLKSCYNKYLTASNHPFLFGATGHKVVQSLPQRLDSSHEWEPINEGSRVKLKTRFGKFLRANGGVPPWRNSITHDIPFRDSSQNYILWDVDIVEIQAQSPSQNSHPPSHQNSLESSGSNDVSVASPRSSEGRTIFYHVAEDDGEVDDEAVEEYFTYKGNVVEEMTQKLERETGLEGIIVCTRNPFNGNLHPLRLQLPPNNSTMHVVLVQSSSKVAMDFAN